MNRDPVRRITFTSWLTIAVLIVATAAVLWAWVVWLGPVFAGGTQ